MLNFKAHEVDWTKAIVVPSASIKETIEAIEKGGLRIALVVNSKHELLGLVTDGDIRRAIINNTPLDSAVSTIMNTTPLTASISLTEKELNLLSEKYAKDHIPLVGDDGSLIDLYTRTGYLTNTINNTVVIMAGGKGIRLRPYTLGCPKPMLPIQGTPILEIIINMLQRQGFRNFSISINYLGNTIKEYFKDGSELGVNITYIEEPSYLGTAGSLSLLRNYYSPVIVINGDIITTIDFTSLLRFHENRNSLFTLCSYKHSTEIQYGVLEVEDDKLKGFFEKPQHFFDVNAGIYVIDCEIIYDIRQMLAPVDFIDMSMVIAYLLKEGIPISVYPIYEYWVDIGRTIDYDKINNERNLNESCDNWVW